MKTETDGKVTVYQVERNRLVKMRMTPQQYRQMLSRRAQMLMKKILPCSCPG